MADEYQFLKRTWEMATQALYGHTALPENFFEIMYNKIKEYGEYISFDPEHADYRELTVDQRLQVGKIGCLVNSLRETFEIPGFDQIRALNLLCRLANALTGLLDEINLETNMAALAITYKYQPYRLPVLV